MGYPEMIRGVMLKQCSRSRSLKSRINLSLLTWEGMIIPTPERIKAKAIATKRAIKSLLCLFGQEGKVELPTKQIRLLPDVLELFVQPLSHFLSQHMKGIVRPLPQTERPLAFLNNQRFRS
jgi:hypothetical protein